MASDKPLSPTSSVKKLKFEQLRADYELFLQTFEKPTWLYRLMQRRNYQSPYMLKRNLPYLQHKIKQHKRQYQRQNFKIDSLLKKLHPKDESAIADDIEITKSDSHLNLSFAGFFHGPSFAEEIFHTTDPKTQDLYRDDFVKIKVILVKIYNKRKKESEQQMDIVELGQCYCPWNPRTQLLIPTDEVKVAISPSAFAETGRPIRTSILSISVHLTIPKKKKGRGRKSKKENENKEPPLKRHRSNRNDSSNKFEEETASQSDGEVFINKQEFVLAEYSAELIVFDRYKTHLLTDGEYELLLQPTEETLRQHGKSTSWENQFQAKV